MLRDIIEKSRSYRRFEHSHAISHETLHELVTLVRFAPSAGNLQPLKFLLVSKRPEADRLFQMLKWARYLEDWTGPAESEKPSAYIAILGDTKIAQTFQYDAGVAAQTILLGAAEQGLGGCIVASVNRDTFRAEFGIPSHLEIIFVIALGKPGERVVIEPVGPGGDIRYYRTGDGSHHVPKRPVEELIFVAGGRK